MSDSENLSEEAGFVVEYRDEDLPDDNVRYGADFVDDVDRDEDMQDDVDCDDDAERYENVKDDVDRDDDAERDADVQDDAERYADVHDDAELADDAERADGTEHTDDVEHDEEYSITINITNQRHALRRAVDDCLELYGSALVYRWVIFEDPVGTFEVDLLPDGPKRTVTIEERVDNIFKICISNQGNFYPKVRRVHYTVTVEITPCDLRTRIENLVQNPLIPTGSSGSQAEFRCACKLIIGDAQALIREFGMKAEYWDFLIKTLMMITQDSINYVQTPEDRIFFDKQMALLTPKEAQPAQPLPLPLNVVTGKIVGLRNLEQVTSLSKHLAKEQLMRELKAVKTSEQLTDCMRKINTLRKSSD